MCTPPKRCAGRTCPNFLTINVSRFFGQPNQNQDQGGEGGDQRCAMGVAAATGGQWQWHGGGGGGGGGGGRGNRRRTATAAGSRSKPGWVRASSCPPTVYILTNNHVVDGPTTFRCEIAGSPQKNTKRP